ncbi:MAG: sigma-70 family RNA polymerase sigma factor [Acidobacteria bacterium]|nr:sigma-70 family RNA polymerase sigma factor [Acidobacteriota bacterium]
MRPGNAAAGSSGGREADLRLADAAASGDDGARRTLALRLADRMRRTARFLLRDEADADDAAQSAMVEVLLCLRRYRGEGSLEHWANRIATRTALELVRRRRRDAEREGRGDAALPAPEETTTCGDEPEVVLRQRLLRCLDRVPDERRATVVLRLVHGMTLEEIARETAVPRNTAKDRLRVGRQELREAVREDPILGAALQERLP